MHLDDGWNCFTCGAAGINAGVLIVLLSNGCHASGAATPKAEDAILAVAEGVKLADQACATTGLSLHAAGKKDDAVLLLKACAGGVSLARTTLLTAESVAATSSTSELACVALPAFVALEGLVASVSAGGGVVPKALTDALTVGSALGRLASCPDGGAGERVLLDAGHG